MFCTNGCSSLGFRASAGGGVPAWACCWGGLPGRLVMVSAGPLQLSLGLLGAGPAGGASVTREPRSWLSSAAPPGLASRGVLADLPSRSLAGLA
jgi:hypothetical protein